MHQSLWLILLLLHREDDPQMDVYHCTSSDLPVAMALIVVACASSQLMQAC